MQNLELAPKSFPSYAELAANPDWIDHTQIQNAELQDSETVEASYKLMWSVLDDITDGNIAELTPDDREARCLLTRKISRTYNYLLGKGYEYEPTYIFEAINTIIKDILDDADTPLSDKEKEVLRDPIVNDYIFAARSAELNDAEDNKVMPQFVRTIFRACHVSDATSEKIFTSYVTGKHSGIDDLYGTISGMAEVIDADLFEVDANGEKLVPLDASSIDRTALPEMIYHVFNIANFSHYNPSHLVRMCIDYNNKGTTGTPNKSLLIRSSSDWNGALEWSSARIQQEDAKALYRNGVIRLEMNSPYSLLRSMLAARRINGAPFESIILSAHGRRDFIQLDSSKESRLTRKLLLKHQDLVRKLIDKCLTPDGVIHVAACNAGHKKGVAYTLWKLTGRDVTASRDITSVLYSQPSNGSLKPVYSERPITYTKAHS